MCRLMAFVLLGMLLVTPALGDLAVAPIEPPAVEGMVAEVPADKDVIPMGELPAEVPDYRGAQKPDLPDAANPQLQDAVKSPTP